MYLPEIHIRARLEFNKYRGSRSFLILILSIFPFAFGSAQTGRPYFHYTVSVPDPASHIYHVQLGTYGWDQDTVLFTMPAWMPGYYQMMGYSGDVRNMVAEDEHGTVIPLNKVDDHTWQVTDVRNKVFIITYDIRTERQFVANSYVDSLHAYIIPENSFLYVEGHIDNPVFVQIDNNPAWDNTVTGLEPVQGPSNVYYAPDFDVLYDSPFLLGDLEELPSFSVKGIEHRFVGYNMGSFDKAGFINTLKTVIESAVDIIGDIPYKQYTFIAIGPGRGGIEHLNNTTVSFRGSQLDSEEGMYRMMNFLAHEYFHNYNVKRIRPFELGPFDYINGSRTNLLWVSEGLSVYYEYLITNRAGLSGDSVLLNSFEQHINTVENNPGRMYQSLVQASYETWEDGPFGNQGEKRGRTISYYEKGPIIGLLLDFAIRHATQNERSLDNVMQFLYREYYKKKQRGFTDAEFQQACETIAGTSLASLFEYVYTTEQIDYNTYLNYAGLVLNVADGDQQRKNYTIECIENPSPLQATILNSWLGDHQ